MQCIQMVFDATKPDGADDVVSPDVVWALRRVSLLHAMLTRLPQFWLQFTDVLSRAVFSVTVQILMQPLVTLYVCLFCPVLHSCLESLDSVVSVNLTRVDVFNVFGLGASHILGHTDVTICYSQSPHPWISSSSLIGLPLYWAAREPPTLASIWWVPISSVGATRGVPGSADGC
jgi:hypothetical protein